MTQGPTRASVGPSPENAGSGDAVVLRVDANSSIGTGHLMRCLALAQTFRDNGLRPVFASGSCPAPLVKRLRDEKMVSESLPVVPGSAEDALETSRLARDRGARWVVVDGYAFGGDYQDILRAEGQRVLFVDDYGHADHYSAELVLNQNVYADPRLYTTRAPHVQLLLGPAYVLLRREFTALTGWKRSTRERGNRLLVTLGGGDAGNVTERIVRALAGLSDSGLTTQVVIGPTSPFAAEVREAAAANGRIQILSMVADMSVPMIWADAAITGAGSTCYEAAMLGLPCLVMVLAENQRPVAEALAEKGVVVRVPGDGAATPTDLAALVRRLMEDPFQRRSMAAAGQALVTGDGARRVLAAMSN